MTFRAVCSTFFTTLVAGLLAVAVSAGAENQTQTSNTQRFDALKRLAGDWVEADKEGKPTDKLVSSFRVTAAGSAVEETIFPGSDHEMITMYHLDGDDLILTHYCMLGNQPRLKAEPGTDPNRIAFKFVGATNLKSDDDHHMHEATFTFEGNDHFQAEWASNKEGKECHRVVLNLVRKAK
ncbi:MAG TPA: hypothetical protein VG826_05170 [Pirellulales bacterium]|nr:hypothetical protein [Pirellulales bacterium]